MDRAVEASRATLLRDLTLKWPRVRELLVTGGEAGDVSRASFPGQVSDLNAQSAGIVGMRHA